MPKIICTKCGRPQDTCSSVYKVRSFTLQLSKALGTLDSARLHVALRQMRGAGMCRHYVRDWANEIIDGVQRPEYVRAHMLSAYRQAWLRNNSPKKKGIRRGRWGCYRCDRTRHARGGV